MIHQIAVPLYYLVDVRNGDAENLRIGANRSVHVGDFICFECNDARFPKGQRRWQYVQVERLSLERTPLGEYDPRCRVLVSFSVVENLKDVSIS